MGGGNQSKVTFGYWGARARGQIGRFLLSYVGADWENVIYKDPNGWFGKDKNQLGLDFPNLPYLIDGDVKITQSAAVQRYIIQRAGKQQLLGKTTADIARITNIVGVVTDVRNQYWKLFFDPGYEPKLKQTWDKFKPKIEAVEKVIGTKDWAMGYFSYADFYISEFSYYFQKLFPTEYKNYPSFQRIRDNFNNLPQIKKYYSQPDTFKGPFVPPNAAIKFDWPGK